FRRGSCIFSGDFFSCRSFGSTFSFCTGTGVDFTTRKGAGAGLSCVFGGSSFLMSDFADSVERGALLFSKGSAGSGTAFDGTGATGVVGMGAIEDCDEETD